MQPSYTRRSRSSSSLPTHPPRVTSTFPSHDQQDKENSTPHAIEEAISSTPFTLQTKKQPMVTFDIAKLNGMLQNFYTKTAQIIIQSRRPTKSTRMNKWFYLAMADIMPLKNELGFWHTQVDYPISTKEPPSTLAIHIYLDTTHLSQDNIYKIMGDYMHQRRWYKTQNKKRIILESWFLLCNSPSDLCVSFDLPSFYKKSITFFRALHSLARLLPGFSLYESLHENDAFSLCYRLGPSMDSYLTDELPPDQPFMEGDGRKQSSLYEFSEMETPIGILQLKVHYRVPIAMNDIYDTHGVNINQRITISPSHGNSNTTHQQQYSQRKSTIFRSQSSPMLHQAHRSLMLTGVAKTGSQLDTQVTYSGSSSSLARRAPTLCISPFKSPALSPIPTSSTSTITTTMVTSSTPLVEKSKSSTIQYGASSRKGEFLSSFEKCKIKSSLTRRKSTEKYPAKSINTMVKQNNDLENFMKFIKTKPELKLFQEPRISDPMNLATTTTTRVIENNTQYDSIMWPPPPVLGSSSIMNTSENDLSQRSKSSLDHFYAIQYAHSDLSESLASTSTTTRYRSSHRQSSSSIATDSSSYDISLSSSSFNQPHRSLSTAAVPITTPPMMPSDTHSSNHDPLSRSLIIDQSSSSSITPTSQKQQYPITPSKSSSQLSTMETLMEEDDAATHET